jgi:hypothetical protein
MLEKLFITPPINIDNKNNQTTSTKCQYQIADSNPK